MSLFAGFANVWTPVELSRRVRRKPVQVRLAGERVVLFRDEAGQVMALIDRCPHRGVALSLGRMVRDPDGKTCLECPFHGWQFSGDGACQHVPLNPDAKRDLLAATPLPTREIGGYIWVYTAPGTQAPVEPNLSDLLTDPQFVRSYLVVDWRCHWTRAMENMLDSPHLPYVHRYTIGMGIRRAMRRDSKIEMSFEPRPSGGLIGWSLDGKSEGGRLEFLKPNSMVLHIPIPGRRMQLQVHCVPLGQNETRMMVVSGRDFGRYNPLLRLFDQTNRIIVAEDKAVVESSDPAEVPPPAQERSVPSDRPTLAFRRYYFDELRPSGQDPPLPIGLPRKRRVETPGGSSVA
jgi:phenylpropionate dioxygenase-like ring-hydroxylating dioxygenase large terminal subunit